MSITRTRINTLGSYRFKAAEKGGEGRRVLFPVMETATETDPFFEAHVSLIDGMTFEELCRTLIQNHVVRKFVADKKITADTPESEIEHEFAVYRVEFGKANEPIIKTDEAIEWVDQKLGPVAKKLNKTDKLEIYKVSNPDAIII